MKKTTAPSFIATNKRDVARFFGLSPTAIDKWRAAGMPGEPLHWNLSDIVRWKLARMEAAAKKAEEHKDPDRRLKELRAKLIKLELETRRRKLVPVEEHFDFIRQLCRNIKAKALSLAATLSSQLRGLDEAQTAEAIRDRVTEMLEDLSDHAGDDPSTEADPKT